MTDDKCTWSVRAERCDDRPAPERASLYRPPSYCTAHQDRCHGAAVARVEYEANPQRGEYGCD